MGKRTILYRGSLKSCNYRCSYCPFSKHKTMMSESERDKRQFQRFCDSIERRAAEFNIGAVFVVPYGEVSAHSWYWEGLGRLAGIPGVDRVGLQTNLSFSAEKCLRLFGLPAAGEEGFVPGAHHRREKKLCIWATFHPEMTDVYAFSEKCRRLTEWGVNLCAGAVGVPENISLITKLREKLSPDIYLWINKMDGLGRNYTEEEKKAFSEIDPFFGQELDNPAAHASMCGDRCFVEADGRVHACNISKAKTVNWYEGNQEEIFRPLCGRKRCSCYLAYGGRTDFAGRPFFGEYPLFRIPENREMYRGRLNCWKIE